MTFRICPQRARPQLRASPLRSALAMVLLIALVGCDTGQSPVQVGGGPSGGTFQGFAGAIGKTVAEINPKLRFKVESSGGSVANLVCLNRHP